MKFYVEGTIFERIQETKAVYDKDNKPTGETKIEKVLGFMMKKKDAEGRQKKSELVYVKLLETEDINKYKEDMKVIIPAKINPWIENKIKAKISIVQDGEIQIKQK